MDQMPVLLREDFSVFIERPVTSAEAPRLVHIPTRHATTPSGPLGNSSTILIHFVVIGPRSVRPHAQVTMGKDGVRFLRPQEARRRLAQLVPLPLQDSALGASTGNESYSVRRMTQNL